jgi:hypothetical protein
MEHATTASIQTFSTRLGAGRSGFRIPTGAGVFSVLQNVRIASEVHLATYSTGTMVLARGYSGLGVKLSTHLHLVPK